jgi:hypothetical protein
MTQKSPTASARGRSRAGPFPGSSATRLRIVSGVLAATLAAGVIHMLIRGDTARMVVATALTAALLGACLWLMATLHRDT